MNMPSVGYNLAATSEWIYGGVDFSLAGNGGPACTAFTSKFRRYMELIFCLFVSSILLKWAFKHCSLPKYESAITIDRRGKKVLLSIVSIVFGMEIAYKFASKTVIFLVNPCHIITAIQIYLLAAPPSTVITAIFRIHLNFLNGAVLAVIFPVTNTLLLPFETEVYFIQHFLMLVTPYYLLRLGGPYNVEDFEDFSWTFLSYGIMIAYQYLIIFPIAIPAEINLAQMLCPAISDPFYGPNYRLFGLVHQAIFVPALCKTYCQICIYFITKFPLTKVKSDIKTDLTLLRTVNTTKNGFKCHHTHEPDERQDQIGSNDPTTDHQNNSASGKIM